MKKVIIPEPLADLYREIDHTTGSSTSAPFVFERPLIAVSANLNDTWGSTIAQAYTDAVIKAGAEPMLLPITNDYEVLVAQLARCDGLLLSGGDDINPYFLDEDPIPQLAETNTCRDKYDLALIHLAAKLCMPVLGICRGEQLMGAAMGSELYQDIYSQRAGEPTLGHNPKQDKREAAHRVTVNRDSRLGEILRPDLRQADADVTTFECRVNSIHHQAIRQAKYPFEVCAQSVDGIIEAIDAFPEFNMLGVQWHPEQMVAGGSEEQLRLFEWLAAEARLYRQARAFHTRFVTLDSHTDTPMKFVPGFDFGQDNDTLVDLPKMMWGQVATVCMVAYLPQLAVTDEGIAKAKEKGLSILAEIHRQVEKNSNTCVLAKDVATIRQAFARGLKAIVPAVENGYMVDSLALLPKLKELGVTYITLCHNGDNQVCDSARRSKQTHGGLSDYGRKMVEEMNRLGLLIDVSHTAPSTVADVLALSSKPIVASHSSVRALCDHERNLTDEQIKAIAAKGGVVQVCLYAGFICEDDSEASYLHAVSHLRHMISLVGVDHLGIGSDFDGDGELIGCRNSRDLIRMTIELYRMGLSDEDIRKIWGENFLRVLEEVQRVG